jgi:hypothetical protein
VSNAFGGEHDEHDDLTPGDPDFERALAQGQFEFAKTRYVRTVTTGVVSKVIEAAERERAKLTDEIKKLQTLARSRYEIAIDAARAYGSVLPHRVGKTWLQPPAPLEKVGEFFGSERLYKIAAKAAKEFGEAQELLAKKTETLSNMERTLRERLDSQEAIVQKQLLTESGLKNAMRRDPLLDVAYKKLLRVSGQDAFEELPLAVDQYAPTSQFPDEPL